VIGLVIWAQFARIVRGECLALDGRQFLASAWWVATFPGLALFATVLGFNLFAHGLRDVLDPALRSGA